MPLGTLAADADEELHVIAVHEGAVPEETDDTESPGIVRVTVEPRPKPVVLSLNTGHPVRWEITLEPGAVLSRVIVGHSTFLQEISGVPSGVPREQLTEDGPCFYGWEVGSNLGGCDYWTAIRAIRRAIGLTETSFQGCSGGSAFTIPHLDGDPPFCRESGVVGDESRERKDVIFPGCEDVTAESTYCLTTIEGAIALLGLDSGRVCRVVDTTVLPGFDTHSISWRGEVVYVCTDDGLVRISLRDGVSETAQLPCEGVANAGDQLLVLPHGGDQPARAAFVAAHVWAYTGYEAVLAGLVEQTYVLPHSLRLTATPNRLYGSWFASDNVVVVEIPSGRELDTIFLEGYDDHIDGLAVTDAGELIVVGTVFSERVFVFDAETGARRRELVLDQPISGLSCVTAP
jgi:hypothetical protein